MATGAAAGPGPAIDHEGARELCLRQLGYAPRTRSQLAATLAGKGVTDQVATEVLDRLEDVRLVDDSRYAQDWVRSRHASRGLSRRAIGQELRRRGVADEVAAQALADLDGAAEEERARELVDAKLRSTRGLDITVRTRRLVGMLARKGYGPGLATRVVREQLALEPDVDPADRRFLDDLDGPLSDLARTGE
ncbi:MAG TPA: regulatory protein RecX [Candidatus Nanopelagicales bacterium]|jgi:regulatory protein|nr:regulatory protein RecX [Candidatus Nanopelagicales bacterium]